MLYCRTAGHGTMARMDEDTPQSPGPQANPPRLGYVRQGSGVEQVRPEVEANCLQALRLAVVSLLFPPLAIVAFVRAGKGLVEANRLQRPGRGHAALAIALGMVLPCLFGLAAMSVWRARAHADVVMCQSNLRQIGQLVLLYENQFPAAVGTDMNAVVKEGGDAQEVPTCVLAPREKDLTVGLPAKTTYMLLPRTRRLGQIPNAGSTVLAVDLSTHPRDRGPMVCLLFCDGHCEARPPEEANKLITASIPVLMGGLPTTLPVPAAERKPK